MRRRVLFKSLPKHSCGLGIQSFTFIHDKLWLSKRYSLKHNKSREIQQIWQDTRHKYIEIDNLMKNKTLPQSLQEHKSSELRASKSHVDSLVSQGIIAKSIDAVITNSYIQEWSNITLSLPESIFQFTRKSLLQLLPTAFESPPMETYWQSTVHFMQQRCSSNQQTRFIQLFINLGAE